MKQRIQLEVTRRITSSIWLEPDRKPGDVVWVNEAAARHLIEEGLCRYIGGAETRAAGPSETAVTGPAEVKSTEAPKKNPSAGPTAGR